MWKKNADLLNSSKEGSLRWFGQPMGNRLWHLWVENQPCSTLDLDHQNEPKVSRDHSWTVRGHRWSKIRIHHKINFDLSHDRDFSSAFSFTKIKDCKWPEGWIEWSNVNTFKENFDLYITCFNLLMGRSWFIDEFYFLITLDLVLVISGHVFYLSSEFSITELVVIKPQHHHLVAL